MKRIATLVLCAMAVTCFEARAQEPTLEDRVLGLEAENRRIVEALEAANSRNAALEYEVQSLRDSTDTLRDELSTTGETELESRVNALAAGFVDPTWSTATKSGFEIRFYGFVRLDAYFNTARATDPIIPFAVLPETGATQSNDSQFAMDSRLTRFAFDIDAGKIGGADVTAKVETDFANFPAGTTESRETPRIRLAYINLDYGNWSVRFGQDWDVISPLYPAVHSELLLWGAGNLGDRRPMVQFLWHSDTEQEVVFTIEMALGMTGAVDGADNDGIGGRTQVDGFDSGHPHGQLRIAMAFDSWVDGKRAEIGIWGYIAGLETDTMFNGEDHYTPFVIGLDLVLPIAGAFSFRAEVWYGQALSDVRGNLLQDINTATGDEIAGWGGWVELHWQVNDTWRIAVGGSIDNPDDSDLNPGTGGENRELNWTLYVSNKFNLGGGLFMGFDVIYWETQWAIDGVGNMIRANSWIQLNF